MGRDALPQKGAEQPNRAATEADSDVNYQICQRNSCCLPRLRFHFDLLSLSICQTQTPQLA